MVNTRGIARLGVLAVGLGIGAAWSHTPVASADSSTDLLSSIDSLLGGAALPALSAPGASDIQISFNGQDLFPIAGNEAHAYTVAGEYGLAIAYGDGASATAEGGTGDYALASGTNALAEAGSLDASSGYNYDYAEDIGNNADPSSYPGAEDGAYAGGGSLIGGTDTGASSHDTAIDIGNNGTDPAEIGTPLGDGGNSGAFAGDAGLIGASGAGNGDFAYTYGNINGFGDGSAAVAGNSNEASTSGSETGTNEGAFAAFGNNNTAIADTSYTTDTDGVSATDGNGNYAYVYGPDNSTASAGGENTTTLAGNNDIAYVYDPLSTTGTPDSAIAGSTGTASGSNDLAEVLLTHGNAVAQGADNLYDIISLLGNETGTAASTGGGLLGELASLF
jgi:hypothetical protein